MQKIERLTPEQETYLPVFRKRYLDIALDPKRIDHDRLLDAVTDAYAHVGEASPRPLLLVNPSWSRVVDMVVDAAIRRAEREAAPVSVGQPPPRLIVCDSPYRCMLTIAVLEDKGLSLRDDEIEEWVDTYIEELQKPGGRKRNMFKSSFLWGSQDMYWIAWGRYAEYIGVKFDETTEKLLDIVERIGRECEWWWPYKGVVVASQKPMVTRWDDENRLHCETGPAIEYADGWTLCAWHGVRIPRMWIEDKDFLSPETALTWRNVEQRRAACELLGWENIIRILSPKIIDEDPSPEIGTLMEVELPEMGREKFLRVQWGRRVIRQVCLPVPREMKTAREANAWSYKLFPWEYAPEVRT
jgi:hypothetical protein